MPDWELPARCAPQTMSARERLMRRRERMRPAKVEAELTPPEKPERKRTEEEGDAFGFEVRAPSKDTRYAMRLLQQDEGAWGGNAAEPGALG